MEDNTIGFKTEKLAAQNTGAKALNLSQVLVVQPPKRESLDSLKLTNAIKASDRGKRSSLFNIFDIIIKDPVIGESIRKRVRHITNGGLTFQKDTKEVPEMVDFIKTPQFRELIGEILMTKFYGKTIIELKFEERFSIYLVPRGNLDTAKKVILRNTNDQEGIPYENDDFILNLGKDNDLGLLMESAPFAIFKRNGGADYAEFCELWGIDMLAALYDPEDDNGREEMEKTVKERGAGGSIVASKNSDIRPIGSSKSGAVHNGFLEWLDNQILIGLIGQLMTTKDGSSHSQSKTHAEVEDDINQDDQQYVVEILNYYLSPVLEKRGYPVKGGWFLYPQKDNVTLVDKLDIAERVDQITEEGVSDDYFYETFGLPKGNKTAKQGKNDPENPENAGTGDGDQPEEDKKKDKAPKKAAPKKLSLYDKVKDFFDQAPR